MRVMFAWIRAVNAIAVAMGLVVPMRAPVHVCRIVEALVEMGVALVVKPVAPVLEIVVGIAAAMVFAAMLRIAALAWSIVAVMMTIPAPLIRA